MDQKKRIFVIFSKLLIFFKFDIFFALGLKCKTIDLTFGIGLKQLGETQEVQDDFELLCWDFVSTPSTPGAYVHPIKEGLEVSSTKVGKYTKVNNIITEILCNNGQCPII